MKTRHYSRSNITVGLSLFLLMIILAFCSCKQENRKITNSSSTSFGYYNYSRFDVVDVDSIERNISGMKYAFIVGVYSGVGGLAISSINLTKDSLEVEALKKQLK